MPNPACEVKNGGAAYVSTDGGVDVTPAATVIIRLIDTSADSWSIECVYTDETSVAATVTSSLVIDSTLRTATFTAPAAGKTYIFRSKVNNGVGADGKIKSSYTTTFGVYTLTTGSRRVVAVNETTEGGAFGWIESVNDLIRNPSGGGTTPTGTGFTRITAGVQDAAASAVNLAGGATHVTGTLPAANQAAQTMGGDVGGTTAASTISNLAVTKLAVGTKSYVLESFDSGAGAAVRWGLRDRPTLVNTTAGSSNDVVTTDANGNQVEVLIYRGTGVATWTGFASGTASRRLVVVNDSADSSALTLSASEVASVAANRMLLVGELASATVPFQSAVVLAYDATDSRWRHVGGSAIPASAISSGTIATTRGGTGQDSSAWTGMAYVASGTWSQASGVRYDSATGQLLLAPDKGVLFRNVADTFSGRLYGDVSGARTWLLPDATGTLVLTDNAQTLTNKTVSGPSFTASSHFAGPGTVATAGAFRVAGGFNVISNVGGTNRPILEATAGAEVILGGFAASECMGIYERVSTGGTWRVQMAGANNVIVTEAGTQFGAAAADFGGGTGVIGIDNATTAPTTNPTGGGILYGNAGAGTWRGSAGTVTAFAPAEPHCPRCGTDVGITQAHNDLFGEEQIHCKRCEKRTGNGVVVDVANIFERKKVA